MVTAELEPKVFTISLPPDLANEAELLATEKQQSVSEVLSDALRAYSARGAALEAFHEACRYGATQNPYGYTEEDIPRLIKEVRAEIDSERAAAQK